MCFNVITFVIFVFFSDLLFPFYLEILLLASIVWNFSYIFYCRFGVFTYFFCIFFYEFMKGLDIYYFENFILSDFFDNF